MPKDLDPNSEFHQNMRELSRMNREDGFLDEELKDDICGGKWRYDDPPTTGTQVLAMWNGKPCIITGHITRNGAKLYCRYEGIVRAQSSGAQIAGDPVIEAWAYIYMPKEKVR